MATIQAPEYKIEVSPLEFEFPNQGLPGGATWMLPTEVIPVALMREAFTVDVTGKVHRLISTTPFRVQVGFLCNLNATRFGLDQADFKIGVKFTEDGEYEYQSVQRQIYYLNPNFQSAWVDAYFTVKEIPGSMISKTYFKLSETTATLRKGGMTLSRARVEHFFS